MIVYLTVYSLQRSDAIWWHRQGIALVVTTWLHKAGKTLVQVIAWWHQATTWTNDDLLANVLWHLPDSNSTVNAVERNSSHVFEVALWSYYHISHGPMTYVLNSLKWRHNERNGVSNHQPHDCLLNRLFRHRSKKTLKFRVTGLCEGNSPVTGEVPAQRASNAENVSTWWRHHVSQLCKKHHSSALGICCKCSFFESEDSNCHQAPLHTSLPNKFRWEDIQNQPYKNAQQSYNIADSNSTINALEINPSLKDYTCKNYYHISRGPMSYVHNHAAF